MPERIQFYAEEDLHAALVEGREFGEQEIQTIRGPQERLSMNRYICQILWKFFISFRAYRNNHDGGWIGYWKLVEDAVTPKKKGKRS